MFTKEECKKVDGILNDLYNITIIQKRHVESEGVKSDCFTKSWDDLIQKYLNLIRKITQSKFGNTIYHTEKMPRNDHFQTLVLGLLDTATKYDMTVWLNSKNPATFFTWLHKGLSSFHVLRIRSSESQQSLQADYLEDILNKEATQTSFLKQDLNLYISRKEIRMESKKADNNIISSKTAALLMQRANSFTESKKLSDTLWKAGIGVY